MWLVGKDTTGKTGRVAISDELKAALVRWYTGRGSDPPRPPACQGALERLRLSGSFERRSLAFLDEIVEPGENLVIGLLPVKIILPGIVSKDQLQGSISPRSLPP